MPKLNSLNHLLLTTFDLWMDVLRFIRLSLQPNWALAAENLFLRKQLALYLERKAKPRRATVPRPVNQHKSFGHYVLRTAFKFALVHIRASDTFERCPTARSRVSIPKTRLRCK